MLTASLLTLPFALVAADAPGVFKIPGTDSTMKIYGFAEMNSTYDMGTRNSAIDDFDWASFLPTQPFDKTSKNPSGSPENQFYWTLRTSRIGIQTVTPTSMGPVTAVVEADFNSPSPSNFSSPATTNGNTFRLRKAYGQIGGFLFGQTWSTFFDGDSVPDGVDFNPVASANATRQGMLAYTWNPYKGAAFTLALEAPFNRQFQGQAGRVVTQDGNENYKGDSYASTPDLLANYTVSGGWGHVSARGVLLQYKDLNNSTNGYGAALSGHFNIGQDSLVWSVQGGDGIGRYMLGSLLQSAIEDGKKINLWKAVGYHVGYTHVWNADWRSNIIASRVSFSDPGSGTPGVSLNQWVQGSAGYWGADGQPNKTLDNFMFNTFYNISKTVYCGVEYNYGKRKTMDTWSFPGEGVPVAGAANEGTQKRINFVIRASFF
jgi:hypothetical protein